MSVAAYNKPTDPSLSYLLYLFYLYTSYWYFIAILTTSSLWIKIWFHDNHHYHHLLNNLVWAKHTIKNFTCIKYYTIFYIICALYYLCNFYYLCVLKKSNLPKSENMKSIVNFGFKFFLSITNLGLWGRVLNFQYPRSWV